MYNKSRLTFFIFSEALKMKMAFIWPLFGLYSILRLRGEKMQKTRPLFIYNWDILHIKVVLVY